jgi:hypothetical protein
LTVSPESRRFEALIALSLARERLADLSTEPERARHLREAFEAVADSREPDHHRLPLVLRRLDLATLIAWEERLAGRVPEGDILVLAERQAPRFARLPAAIERLDGRLRLWPAAGLVLLGLVIWLGGGFLMAA